MTAFYLRDQYCATGEGITSFIVLAQADDKKDFINLCKLNGIDEYYLKEPFSIFVEAKDIPEEELLMIQKNYPVLYKRIERKQYNAGSFWWSVLEHINMF